LLEGGYESEVLTTVYGPAGSGKTTTCLLSAISAAKSKKIIFIDTEGGFSVARLKQLSKDYRKILDRIILLKPTTFEMQKKATEQVREMVNTKFGLIICDTISALYRAERGEENSGLNREFGKQLATLLEIARTKKIPVLLTNQVYADFQDKTRVNMVGGDIVKYTSKCLLELRTLSSSTRQATLRKHRSLPERTVQFKIEGHGFAPV